MQRQRDFILDQQAQLSAGLTRVDRQIEANSRLIENNSTRINQLVDVCFSLTHPIERLTEAREQADSKLNACIETVDKLVRHRNGSKPTE